LLVRDQAHGVYGIDSATAAAGAGSPTGAMAEQAPADEYPDSFAART
jgi:hypothetical protein